MKIEDINIILKKTVGEKIKKIIFKCFFPLRNNFILFSFNNKAIKNRVNLNYCYDIENLGDLLSPIVVNHILQKRNLSLDKKIAGLKHLYAIGSILTAGMQDATVWGSGVRSPKLYWRLENRKFDIRAVRGPITRAVMLDYGFECPEVYGDPAIFLPEIYEPPFIEKRYKYGIVMHMDQIYDFSKSDDTLFIDIRTSNYKDFVNKIKSVDIVISSSLHGIIIAESYGVKAVLLKPNKDIIKYFDWYYSTERYSFPIAKSIEDAKKTNPANLPSLDTLRDNLIKAFPYDIFEV